MTLPKQGHRWRGTGWYCWYSHTSDSSLHGHAQPRFKLQREKHLWKTEQHRAPCRYKPGTGWTTSAEPCVCSVALQGTQPRSIGVRPQPRFIWVGRRAQKSEKAADHVRFGDHCSLQRSCPILGCLIIRDFPALQVKSILLTVLHYLIIQVLILSWSSPVLLQWKWYVWVSLNGGHFLAVHIMRDSKAELNQAWTVNVFQLVPLMLSTRLFCYISLPFVALCSEMVGWNLPYL